MTGLAEHPPVLMGAPDPAVREAKARSRQLIAEIVEPVRAALAAAPAWQRLAVVEVPPPFDGDRPADPAHDEPAPDAAAAEFVSTLRGALERESGLSVRVVDPQGRRSDDDWPDRRSEIAVVVLTGLEPAEVFCDVVARAFAELVAAGRLVLVTDVAPLPGTEQPVPLGTSQVMALLTEATGQGLVLEDLKSVRWGRDSVHRGLVLTATSIGVPEGIVW